MEKLIKTRKQKRGITLVSLVITIIILLILAGITINLIIREDGIIKRAQEAGKNYMDAAEYERLQLAEFTNEMDNIIGSSTNNGRTPYNSEFRNNVIAAISQEGVETLETDTEEVIIGNIGKIFEERTRIDNEVAATAENITAGKQAYVNGQLITGNGADSQVSIKKMAGKGQTWLNNFSGTYLNIPCETTDIVVISSVSINGNSAPTNNIVTDGVITSYCNNSLIYENNSKSTAGKASFAYVTGATYVKVNAYSYGTDGICFAAYCII